MKKKNTGINWDIAFCIVLYLGLITVFSYYGAAGDSAMAAWFGEKDPHSFWYHFWYFNICMAFAAIVALSVWAKKKKPHKNKILKG